MSVTRIIHYRCIFFVFECNIYSTNELLFVFYDVLFASSVVEYIYQRDEENKHERLLIKKKEPGQEKETEKYHVINTLPFNVTYTNV